jgi:hypothetical protein
VNDESKNWAITRTPLFRRGRRFGPGLKVWNGLRYAGRSQLMRLVKNEFVNNYAVEIGSEVRHKIAPGHVERNTTLALKVS